VFRGGQIFCFPNFFWVDENECICAPIVPPGVAVLWQRVREEGGYIDGLVYEIWICLNDNAPKTTG